MVVSESTGRVGNRCPGCGQLAVLAFLEQAFCGDETCRVMNWNPTKTLDEQLEHLGVVDTDKLFGQ